MPPNQRDVPYDLCHAILRRSLSQTSATSHTTYVTQFFVVVAGQNFSPRPHVIVSSERLFAAF